jgi:hypothetical protein
MEVKYSMGLQWVQLFRYLSGCTETYAATKAADASGNLQR